MKFIRLLIPPVLAIALILTAASLYSVAVVEAHQRSAQSKKPTQYHFVCPMHEDITSKKRGTCPKCKMKLVRKPVPKEQEPSTGSNKIEELHVYSPL